jgi:5-formyltetrahydrofolate cyclo-ligase
MEGTLLKSQLRKQMRERRRAIDPDTRRQSDQAINRSLLELVERSGSASLSAYLSFDGEPDLRPALDTLGRRGVRIALPVLLGAAVAGSTLQFRIWDPGMALSRNAFGIEEPPRGEVVLLQDLDLVLMPLVAWDARGHRLGMGAGYYDRALAGVAERERPLRAGIAYHLQQVERLPTDPWDVVLHQVITEEGRFTCAA